MRDIKFRAWDNRQKEIHTWESLKCNSISVAYLFNNTDLNLLQYTGLKDKNEVEIYEGDIIKTKNSKYRVEYNKCCFWGIDEMGKYPIYQIKHYVMEDEIFEVIGNIYENPEMLENENI